MQIDYIKANCENERVEQERLVIPLKRELELLRTQKFSEGQFGETYRRMDAERKQLREEIQKLSEEKDGLRKDLDTLTVQYHTMVDDYTVSNRTSTLYHVGLCVQIPC